MAGNFENSFSSLDDFNSIFEGTREKRKKKKEKKRDSLRLLSKIWRRGRMVSPYALLYTSPGSAFVRDRG